MQMDNPVLSELDSLSPHAKSALAQAHGKLLTLNTGGAPLGPAPDAAAGAPVAPRLQPIGQPSEQPPSAPAGMLPTIGTQQPPTQSPGMLPTLAQPSAQVDADRTELNRKITSGSGISQIHNPFLKTLGMIGDAIGTGLFPRIAAQIPGTTAHHQQLVGEDTRKLESDEDVEKEAAKNQLTGAQAAEQASLPQYHQSQAENAGLRNELTGEKNAETERNNRAKTDTALRQHGYKHDEQGNVVPLDYSEMSEQQQAVHDYNASRSELASATSDLRKAQKSNIPIQMQMAQARIANAQHNTSVAERRLSLSERQQEMRAHGTENGEILPGTQLDQEGRSVGTANAANVRPTMQARNASERADSMLDLDQRIRKALQNPEIANRTGPISGRLAEAEGQVGTLPHDLAELKNDLVSYGAFQAGLHPVRGIGALQYFDKVMGGLGQDPDQLLGKLDSNKTTAESVQRVGKVNTAKSGSAPNVTTKAQYDALPKGAEYMEDGKKYRKP